MAIKEPPPRLRHLPDHQASARARADVPGGVARLLPQPLGFGPPARHRGGPQHPEPVALPRPWHPVPRAVLGRQPRKAAGAGLLLAQEAARLRGRHVAWPKGTLVQLGYTKTGDPILFIGQIRASRTDNTLWFSDRGVALARERLSLLESVGVFTEPTGEGAATIRAPPRTEWPRTSCPSTPRIPTRASSARPCACSAREGSSPFRPRRSTGSARGRSIRRPSPASSRRRVARAPPPDHRPRHRRTRRTGSSQRAGARRRHGSRAPSGPVRSRWSSRGRPTSPRRSAAGRTPSASARRPTRWLAPCSMRSASPSPRRARTASKPSPPRGPPTSWLRSTGSWIWCSMAARARARAPEIHRGGPPGREAGDPATRLARRALPRSPRSRPTLPHAESTALPESAARASRAWTRGTTRREAPLWLAPSREGALAEATTRAERGEAVGLVLLGAPAQDGAGAPLRGPSCERCPGTRRATRALSTRRCMTSTRWGSTRSSSKPSPRRSGGAPWRTDSRGPPRSASAR